MRTYDLSNPANRTIGNVIREQAREIGGEAWLLSNDRVVTFREGNELTNRYANGLAALGVRPGDIVAMVMDPSIDVVLLAVATAKLGGIFTTISTDYTGKFLEEALAAAKPVVIVIDEAIAPRLDKLAAIGNGAGTAVPVLVNGAAPEQSKWQARSLQELLSYPDTEPTHQPNWLDPVQVWWSSGTTGKPKGVCHSHSSILMQTVSHDRDIRQGDTLYSCTPVYLGSSWTGTIWPSLVMGVRGAIDAKFSVSRFWDRINHYKATHAFTLGAMHIHLWNAPEAPTDRDNTLRRFSAIPMPAELIPRFKRRFGIENMHQGYGTSETFRVFDAPEDGEDRTGAILGRPVAHLEVRILDENDLPLPPGQAGEICVRPREPGRMFCGYFNNPQQTADCWRSLWHHTGDMAYQGEDGIYRFADRKKDYIRYKGRNISMFEVEAVVAEHPAVKDVAAFGIPSKELESEAELMIVVVCKDGHEVHPEQIARFVNEEAPHYFVPRFIDFAASLPRNDHGRLMKNELRDRGTTPTCWDREAAGFEIVRP